MPGEAVVFHYRYFIGASKSIKLRSMVSLRINTMLVGRMTFPIAVCDRQQGAHLLLAVRSLDPMDVRDNLATSALIERLVAWNAHVAFQAQLTEKMSSLYLDPFSLTKYTSRQPFGRMIVDTRYVTAKFYGIFRYALRAMSPF